jgi:hypothetical protein
MENLIKTNNRTLIKIIGLLIIIFIFEITLLLWTLHSIHRLHSSNITQIADNCKDVLLNLSNPYSYINKVTKPFLIELVKNATKNTN